MDNTSNMNGEVPPNPLGNENILGSSAPKRLKPNEIPTLESSEFLDQQDSFSYESHYTRSSNLYKYIGINYAKNLIIKRSNLLSKA